MLLSFKFLIVCTVGIEIFVSEKILFVISVGAVFPSRFFRCTERRGVNHLCWSSDEIDPLVVAYHVDAPLSVRFLNTSALGNCMEFLYFT